MNIINDITDYTSPGPCGVALGNFDGVHIGHKKLIETLIDQSKTTGLSTSVFTFEPHPMKIINPLKNIPSLTTLPDKIKIMESFGIDTMVIVPFSKAFSMTNPEEFIRNVLYEKLKARLVVVGFDYRFGHAGSGDTIMLKSLGNRFDYETIVIPPVMKDGIVVSSSAIRKFISEGDVYKAIDYLGRPYKLSGKIVKGDGLGHSIGFPTVNVNFSPAAALPQNGVYAVLARTDDQEYNGVANIGVKPTFSKNTISLEVHLIGIDQNLYGRFIEVEFIDKIRNEMAFSCIEALAAQIKHDILIAQNLLHIYKTQWLC